MGMATEFLVASGDGESKATRASCAGEAHITQSGRSVAGTSGGSQHWLASASQECL